MSRELAELGLAAIGVLLCVFFLLWAIRVAPIEPTTRPRQKTMNEPMTTKSPDLYAQLAYRMRESLGEFSDPNKGLETLVRELAAFKRAHLAQSTQAVDVGAIREVIDRLRINPSITAQECADSLAVALSGEKSGPVGDGWKLAMFVLQSGLYDKLPEEERAVCDALVQQNPYLPASPAPDKEG